MPSTRCHEYESGFLDDVQVNVTSFKALTVEMAGLASASVITKRL